MKNFKGLFSDTSYLKNPEGTWQKAKNILLTKQFNSPVNENGTAFSHLVRGKVVGIIDTNTEIVYLSKINDSDANSLISIYDLDTAVITEKVKGNFNFNRPIEGVYKYDYKSNLIIAFCDGVFEDSNTPKIIKITNIDLPLNDILLEDKYLELIALFPNINKGRVLAQTTEGNIDGIYAYVTFKYGYKEEETVFQDINTYCILKESLEKSIQLLSKGIKLTFSDLNYQVYEYIRIGIYVVGEDKNNSYISKKINISSPDLVHNVSSLINFESLVNTELLIPKGKVLKANTIAGHKESIFLGNVKIEKEFKFQKYANLLTIIPQHNRPASDSHSGLRLAHGEVYAFYVQLELTRGRTTQWYHIPNTDWTEADTLKGFSDPAITNKYDLDSNAFDSEDLYETFIFENRGTTQNFGIWLNKETYPINDEYNSTVDYDGTLLVGGKDLRGERIGYHRVMDFPRNGALDTIPISIKGVRITNFSSVVPASIREEILYARIGFAKRDLGNSLIVANGVIVPVRSTQENDLPDNFLEKIESSPFSDDYNNGSNVRTGAERKGYSFDRALFLSPEIEKFKPNLDWNITRFNSFTFRNAQDYPVVSDRFGDRITITNAEGDQATKDQNRYYKGFYSYDYKLPNNSAQGVAFLDGGLYINFRNVENNYINNTESVIPYTKDTVVPAIPSTKTIELAEHCFFPVVQASLMNVKDNLYSLTSEDIVSSNNALTIAEIEDYNFNAFWLGDVALCYVKGGLGYQRRDGGVFGSWTDTYFSYYLYEPCFSPLNKATLEIIGNQNPYDETGETDTAILNTFVRGYDVNVHEYFASVNDLAQYEPIDIAEIYLDSFPYRILRSTLVPNESFVINALRTFYINNYIELDNNKGDIIALRANDTQMYIQLRYGLYHGQVKDVLTTENTDAFLQIRDIFDRPPQPLTLDPKGYIGCEHKFSCIMTKIGYIVIDHKQGNIVLATPEIKLISSIGLRNELINKLEFESNYREVLEGKSIAIDNPYDYIGFSVGFDERYQRIFITKLYPPTITASKEESEYFNDLLNQDKPDIDTPILIDNLKSFTYSFSPEANFWLSKHTQKPCRYMTFKKDLLAIRNVPVNATSLNTGVLHSLNRGLKGMYFGVKEESYIDLIFNANSDVSKSLYNIELITEAIIEHSNGKTYTNNTISKLFVFSDKQASAILELDLNDADIIREAEGTFKVNNIRDILINSLSPILDDEGEINQNNLNNNKNWFDKSYFIGKFIVIRLIWDNTIQDDIYINEVKAISAISKR